MKYMKRMLSVSMKSIFSLYRMRGTATKTHAAAPRPTSWPAPHHQGQGVEARSLALAGEKQDAGIIYY